jgi:hypothetical protein
MVALGLGAKAAGAQPRETAKQAAFELDWRAPSGCPEARAVRAEVLRLARIDTSPRSQLRATAEIRTDGQTWELTLSTELDGISGERTLTANTCRALSDAATLTLALILNPDVETAQSEPVVESDALEVGVALSARAGAEHGQLAELGPSFALGAGFLLGAASVWGYAGFAPPQETRVSGSSGRSRYRAAMFSEAPNDVKVGTTAASGASMTFTGLPRMRAKVSATSLGLTSLGPASSITRTPLRLFPPPRRRHEKRRGERCDPRAGVPSSARAR